MKKLTFEEWMEWRRSGIGGSEAPIVMNASKWSSRFELWARKTKRLRPQPVTYIMRRGLRMEPFARAAYEQEFGIPMPAKPIQHLEIPFLRASLDGLNFEALRSAEFKCPGKEDHATALKGEVPGHYVWQLVHNLMVSGLPVIDYYSFYAHGPREKWNGVNVEFKRNERLEKQLWKAEKEFWKLIVKDIPPEIEIEEEKPLAPTVKKLSSNVFPIKRK